MEALRAVRKSPAATARKKLTAAAFGADRSAFV